jgi:hypothetical protein
MIYLKGAKRCLNILFKCQRVLSDEGINSRVEAEDGPKSDVLSRKKITACGERREPRQKRSTRWGMWW